MLIGTSQKRTTTGGDKKGVNGVKCFRRKEAMGSRREMGDIMCIRAPLDIDAGIQVELEYFSSGSFYSLSEVQDELTVRVRMGK